MTKIKLCIISAASDATFRRFTEGCKFIPEHWEIHVLRNKPLLDSSLNLAKSYKNIFIHWKENSEYTLLDVKYGLKMLKLRYDSVTLTNPQENEWFIFGDDDMFFDERYLEISAPNIEKLAESDMIDFMVGTLDSSVSYSFTAAKREGIRHGQLFRYRKKIFDEYGKYADYLGGGEDSLFAVLNYMYGRCITNITPGVDHIGHNLANYIPKPWEQDKNIYIASVVTGMWLDGEDVRKRNDVHTECYTECKAKGLIYSPASYYFNPKQFRDKDKVDYRIEPDSDKHSGKQSFDECGFTGNVYENNCVNYRQLNPYVHPCKWLGYSKVCVVRNKGGNNA